VSKAQWLVNCVAIREHLTHNQLVPGSSLGGTTSKKPQLVDLQLVEVLFLYNIPFGVLYRVPKFRNFSYIRKI